MNNLNNFIVEGKMIERKELTENSSCLTIEYKEDSHLKILVSGILNENLKDNFKQFKNVRIVGRFISNQGLIAEHLEFRK